MTRIRDKISRDDELYLIGSKKNCSALGSGELERTPRCSEVSVPGVLAQWVSIYSMNRTLMVGFIRIRYGSLGSLVAPSDAKLKGAVL